MKIQDMPFTLTDWKMAPTIEHKGDSGTSFWRTYEAGDLRVRMVEYSPDFRSDHYYTRGHVLLVLEGELIIRLKDGNEYTLTPGKSFQVSDDKANPHLAYSHAGARVFIVD
jgi:quercetin dioxygenase-like cupin family protein